MTFGCESDLIHDDSVKPSQWTRGNTDGLARRDQIQTNPAELFFAGSVIESKRKMTHLDSGSRCKVSLPKLMVDASFGSDWIGKD